jgi:hypothetical protein
METFKELFLGQNSVIQNNDSVFEMKMKRFNPIVSGLIIIAITFFLVIATFGDIGTAFDLFKTGELAAVFQRIQEIFPTTIFWPMIGYFVLILFIVFGQGWRIAYLRIDGMQIQTKTIWQLRFGHEGKTYYLTNPATLESNMKGFGKNKRVELLYTSPGNEKVKIKLWAQVFGSGALNLLDEWVRRRNV